MPPSRNTALSNGQLTEGLIVVSQTGGSGCSPGAFNQPHGFALGPDDEIVIADTLNNRIQVSYNLFLSKCI